MFKSLRKKLFGFNKKLEEELAERIEAELQEGKTTPTPPAEPAKPVAPAPKPEPTHAPTPVAPAAAPKPEPAATAPAPAKPEAPRTYKDAKREGLEREAAQKKESIEERLERELQQAAQLQEAIEEDLGTSGGRVLIEENALEDMLWDLELGLLESDVALPVIEAIKSSVREQLTVIGVPKADPHTVVTRVLKTAIHEVLQVGKLDFDAFIQGRLKEGKRPVVIMFVGVNGTGKTTTIAKIAHRLKGQGVTCVMAAGDTFRAGAIEQLTLHSERLGVKIIKHGPGSDPAAVAFDALEHAKSRHKDVVLLDTAGRMQTNTNLMDEMAKIKRVARPDLIVFVGDALAGNDAVEQAREFNKVVSIDGVVLTKVDADAKGGAALSVAYTIGKPLLFVGIGQEYDDQVPFNAQWMLDRLFADDADEEA
jgi:fused signal recognition particle receptor